MRSDRHLLEDVNRAIRASLQAEIELEAAHAVGDWERAWKAAVELKRANVRSRKAADAWNKRQRA